MGRKITNLTIEDIQKLPPLDCAKSKIKIGHIINPVNVPWDHGSHLYYAQPVTYMSMVTAKEYCEHVTGKFVEINLYTTQYEYDHPILPYNLPFTICTDLEYSIHDFESLKDKSRILPRISDIIHTLYQNSDAEFLIYSNADISVYREFYMNIAKLIQQGYDGLCIHRTDIPKDVCGIGRLDVGLMDIIVRVNGKEHPGHDCFVFKRSIVPNMNTGNVFIGYPPVGKTVRHQIKLGCSNMAELHSNTHMTFHLGEDTSWNSRNKINHEYRRLNKQLAKLINE